MKLLLDENISDRIVPRIVDLFPGSTHVKIVGLTASEDAVVWEWARQGGFEIVSNDNRLFAESGRLRTAPEVYLVAGR